MKKIVITLLLLATSLPWLSAQKVLEGIVIDAETNLGIPFVNIGLVGKDVGTVTDENGQFRLHLKGKSGKIAIFTIGYEKKTFSLNQLKNPVQITLKPKSYNLEAVEIDAKRLGEELVLGLKLEKKSNSIGFSTAELGTEIGALIEIDKETLLKTANFRINHAKGDSLLYRVNIYSFQDDEVGENLLTENVIISGAQMRGTYTVDLTPFNLVVDQDVILSLEWIKDDNGKGNIGLSFNSKKAGNRNNVFLKTTSFASFYRLSDYMTYAPRLRLSFYFTARQVE